MSNGINEEVNEKYTEGVKYSQENEGFVIKFEKDSFLMSLINERVKNKEGFVVDCYEKVNYIELREDEVYVDWCGSSIEEGIFLFDNDEVKKACVDLFNHYVSNGMMEDIDDDEFNILANEINLQILISNILYDCVGDTTHAACGSLYIDRFNVDEEYMKNIYDCNIRRKRVYPNELKRILDFISPTKMTDINPINKRVLKKYFDIDLKFNEKSKFRELARGDYIIVLNGGGENSWFSLWRIE